MAQPALQASFNSGEWSPKLFARVDLEKYHSAAALLNNFFVDYRGGASTRTGSRYVVQAYKSATAVRLIPFQASFTVSYVLEFGDGYIRFHNNGAPVLEAAKAISGASKANPCQLTITSHGYNSGDWIYVTGVGGMTQLNGRYFLVLSVPDANHVNIGQILNGANVNSTGYSVYTVGGTAQRIYTLPSPYAAADLKLLKYVQNVNSLIICHPSHAPNILTLVSAANWTISQIVFGTTISAPTGLTIASTLAAGSVYYAYVITAVDANGQESPPSIYNQATALTDIRTNPGSIVNSWTAVSGAVSYNVYKAEPRYGTNVPAGAQFGFVGNCSGTTFVDSNISPDFTNAPPIVTNPFVGAGVASVTITNNGIGYSTVPGVTFGAPPVGVTAIGQAQCQVMGTPTVSAGGNGFSVGQIVQFRDSLNPSYGFYFVVASIGAGGAITAFQPMGYPGTFSSAVLSGALTNLVADVGGLGAFANIQWGVSGVQIASPGTGYLSPPTVTFSAGTAAGTAVLGQASSGNPSVPGFIDQRLVLAGPVGNPQLMNLSQPGDFFNFNISNPIQGDDAITAQLVSGQLNTIKSMLQMPSGMVVLTDRQNWLVNSGGQGGITPINFTANSQSYSGASDVPPIVANFNILFVQSKGSIVRDLTYNFYVNIWTGTDISILASHLFYGYMINEWAWAEEPFKVVWAVRSDGIMLTLTYLKEQELVGWAHSVTNGLYKSVAAITESVTLGAVDAIYTVVQRTVQGVTVQYIERFAERTFFGGAKDAWCVDAGLQYSGAPATSFSGGEHLGGLTVTGLADGVVIPPFVMPTSGAFTLAQAASKVTVGLGYTCQLQTMPIDPREFGPPTPQGKVKKINAVDIRVAETLGLKIGSSTANLVVMKDLVVGNVSSMLTGQESQIVTDLVTGDARTIIDPRWTVPGQYLIQQDQPLPATILGVFPQVIIGDTPK